jgi:CRP-like cAMP-binding protein
MKQLTLETYVLDALMPDIVGHDRRPASFIAYLYLYRQASQRADWSTRQSHQEIADATGLSRSAVQTALAHLQRRQLVSVTRSHATAVPLHRVLRPWLRLNRPRP